MGQSENASPFQLTECKNFLDPAGAKHYGGGINYHGGTRKAWANKADRQLGDRVCTLGSTTGGGGRSTCHENSLGILWQQHSGDRWSTPVPLWSHWWLEVRPASARLLPGHWDALCSICSLFLGSQKKCSFRGSSFTSTGMASYSSLSMLKEPSVPWREEGFWMHLCDLTVVKEASPPRAQPNKISQCWMVPETPQFSLQSVKRVFFSFLKLVSQRAFWSLNEVKISKH